MEGHAGILQRTHLVEEEGLRCFTFAADFAATSSAVCDVLMG